MIKISDNDQRKLQTLCKIHCEGVYKYVLKQARKVPKTDLTTEMLDFLYELVVDDGERIKAIIKCLPKDFEEIHEQYKEFYSDEKGLKTVQGVFNYKNFAQRKTYSAYHLVKNLNVRVCPYCNRQYITATKKGKRPALDHFYPFEKYPIFGLSFYNLIPSCTFCNSNHKQNLDTMEKKHAHPYIEEYCNKAVFRYKGIPDKTHLVIQSCDEKEKKKFKNNKETFDIDGLYESHSDIAKEIYEKSLENSPGHFESIKETLSSGLSRSIKKEEFYNFYFSNYMQEKQFGKRPLAKFTSDLVTDLGTQAGSIYMFMKKEF